MDAREYKQYQEQKKQQKESGSGIVKVWVFGLLLIASAGFFFSIFHTIQIVILNLSVESWPVTQGVVTRSVQNVRVVNTGRNSSYPESRYFADIEYTYTVDSVQYQSTQYSIGQHFSYTQHKEREKTAHLLQTYPKGKLVDVRYRPSDPGYSVLDTTGGGFFMYIPLGLIVFIGALANLRFFAKGDLIGTEWKERFS